MSKRNIQVVGTVVGKQNPKRVPPPPNTRHSFKKTPNSPAYVAKTGSVSSSSGKQPKSETSNDNVSSALSASTTTENLRSYRIKPYRPVGSKKSDQETDESINSKTKKNQSDGEEKNNLSESQSTKDSASQSRPPASVTKNPASIATTVTKKLVPPPPNKSHTKQNESKKDNSSSTEKTVSNASVDQSPSITETNSSVAPTKVGVAPAKVIQTPSKLPAVPKAPLRSTATNSPSNQSSVSVSINNTTEDQNLENLNTISAQNLKKRKAPDSSISVELEPSTKKRVPQFKSDEEKEPTATTLSSLKHSSGIESRWMAPVSSIDPMTMSLPEIEMEINFITPSIDYLKKALAKS